LAKVNVYVDGFNLYYGALKRTPFKWLNLSALCQILLPIDSIQSIKYFTARVSARPTNPSAAHDQGLYIRALRTIPNLEIKYGQFRTHSVQMCLSNVAPIKRVWVDKTEEKGSDVNLACHLLRDAFLKQFEFAAVISNDSDLAEPIRIVSQELKLPICIINPHQHHSKELQRYAMLVKRIRQGQLLASQFPSIVTDRKGSFSKPPTW
jgi:NYN domain-containing protein